jgi:hypothetical protein
MDEDKEPSTGWKRTKDTFTAARVTAQVAMHTLNPLYGPVAQQLHLEPVADQPEIVRQIDRRELQDDAEWELRNREEEAGQVVREDGPVRPDKGRQAHQDSQPRKTQSRDRHRDP